MKVKYDRKKRRIVIDGKGAKLFRDIDGKMVLIPTIEIENDAKESNSISEFRPVAIDSVRVDVVEGSNLSYPIRISIINDATYGEDDAEETVPGDVFSIEKARRLADALRKAADLWEAS